MGLRFRKSISKGPFRVNFSKSGIGYSVGGKGVRFTKTANGRNRSTFSIPGTGISYVSESKGKKNKTKEPNDFKISNSNNNGNDKNKKALYNVLTIIFLIVFLPIGLYLLWKKTTWSKKTKIVLSALFSLYFIGLLNSSEKTESKKDKIESIVIAEQKDDITIDSTVKLNYTVSPNENKNTDFKLNSSDKDLAILTFKDDELFVETKATGTAYLWIEADGISSNKVKINIIEDNKAEAIDDKPTDIKKPKEEQAQIKNEQPTEAQEKSHNTEPQQEPSTNKNEVNAPVDEVIDYVYIAGSGNGKKYHSRPGCSNMKNPIEISKDDAQARSYTPCKKCY